MKQKALDGEFPGHPDVKSLMTNSLGSIPGQRTLVLTPQATQCSQKKKKNQKERKEALDNGDDSVTRVKFKGTMDGWIGF